MPPHLTVTALPAVLLFMSSTPMFAEVTNAPPARSRALKIEVIAKDLENPWGLQFLPDGRLLVTEKSGQLRIVTKEGEVSEPVAGIPEVDPKDQGGLLDVLVAPDFADSGTIFFSYSEPRGGGKNGTSVARARLILEADAGKLEDLKVIFRQEPAAASGLHFGSRLVLARDGSLFVTTGERNALRAEAQNPANHIGKVIHITPDGEPAADNPKLPGWDAKVWSIGHRNIQGAALNPATGKLWTVEHGARGGDELNIPEKGKNYGWPVITWGVDYSGAKIGEGTTKAGMEQPIYYWVPSIATSGLAFYTGDLFPEWKGNAFVGGLKSMQIQRLVLDGEKVVGVEKLLDDQNSRVRDIRQGPDGALWVITDETDGRVLRLTPAE